MEFEHRSHWPVDSIKDYSLQQEGHLKPNGLWFSKPGKWNRNSLEEPFTVNIHHRF